MELPRHGGNVSVSFAIIYGAAMIMGPRAAMISAAVGVIKFWKYPSDPIWFLRTLFNITQYSLAAGLSGMVFIWFGGAVGQVEMPAHLLPALSGAAVFILINGTLVLNCIAVQRKISAWGLWVGIFRWTLPSLLAEVPVSIGLALLQQSMGVTALIVLTLPLLIVRHTFQRTMERRKVLLSSLAVLSTAIEAKDPYTQGHCERVSRYVGAIARKLKIPEDQVEKLEYIGLMHDIGKIMIHSQIINKPGKLDEREFREMSRHSAVGGEILRQIRLFGDGYSWVRHHHERFDGKGYPDGLKPPKLPREARIILVADSFDAMTSTRSYRRAMSVEMAVAELDRCAGIQFDPEIVKAMKTVAADMGLFRPNAESETVAREAAAAAEPGSGAAGAGPARGGSG